MTNTNRKKTVQDKPAESKAKSTELKGTPDSEQVEKPTRLDVDAIGYTLLLKDTKAPKLSPKSKGHIFFEIGCLNEDKSLHIRMTGNDGGGLHTKEWIGVTPLLELLDKQEGNVFKSTVLKTVIKGASSNNASFLAAVLRSKQLGLLAPSENSQFLHQLDANYQTNKAKLLALVPSS
ncbi:hypothetical protein [Vibrio vulnificus]|uniref:hypothetical protein n=1 Tax=Vibrio vulnificus TaxID=672 RepID=UPI0006984E30|nr:hypothetical protein [Vibrio vulnificus]